MSYRTKLTATIASLIGFVFFMAGLLTFGGNRVSYNLERSRYAYAELETYLTLSADTFRLFKQLRRDLIDNDRSVDRELDESRRNFESRLALLKRQIDEDQRFGATENRREKDERQLARLAALTEEIQKALDDVKEAQSMFARGERRQGALFLSRALEQRVDQRVSKLLDEGIHYERLTANAAKDEVRSVVRWLNTATWAVALVAAGFGAIFGLLLLRQVAQPVQLLSAGAMRFAGGALDHRIMVPGRDEFAALARSFNDMAGQIAAKTAAIGHLNSELERKIADRTAELERANAALSEKEIVRRQFFADVGHELRTPITIIRGEAEVALRAKSETECGHKQALTTIVDYAAHLTQLVADIFVVARSDAGVLQFRRDELDLTAMVRKATQDLEHVSTAAQQKLLAVLPPIDSRVIGDHTRLLQLLSILVDNAARHAGHGATVIVGLENTREGAQLTVSDNGPGIPEEDVPHVFDRYYRGHNGYASHGAGAGLGLPLARAIVNAHGGRITLDSAPGAGTTVTVLLPVLLDACQPLNEAN